MDLPGRLRDGQGFPPLETGADQPDAGVVNPLVLRDHLVFVQLQLAEELDVSLVMAPAR
jgi:hypothetical protein